MATKLDYLYMNKAGGSVAARLLKNKMDVGCLRPFVGKNGMGYIDVTTDVPDGKGGFKTKAMRTNNTSLLTRDAWYTVDQEVLEETKPLLQAVGDLRSRNLVLDIDGMANPILMYQTIGRITGATISMDGMREGEKDKQEYDTAFTPLPIIHKDCSLSMRQVVSAQRAGLRIDTSLITEAAAEIAISAEKLLIGTLGSFSYGPSGSTVYGYTNHPLRATKVMTLPTAAGWTPEVTLNELLTMRQTLRENLKAGPFQLYISPGWEIYLGQLFSAAYNAGNLRSQIMNGIVNLAGITTLDYLTDYQMLLVSMDRRTVREIVGMDIRTIQWESPDGMELFWKVMCILVPQFRFDQSQRAGIVHGTAS